MLRDIKTVLLPKLLTSYLQIFFNSYILKYEVLSGRKGTRGGRGGRDPTTGGLFTADLVAPKNNMFTFEKRQFFAFYSIKLKINVIDKSLKKKISIR